MPTVVLYAAGIQFFFLYKKLLYKCYNMEKNEVERQKLGIDKPYPISVDLILLKAYSILLV